jgi:hypothetical protein
MRNKLLFILLILISLLIIVATVKSQSDAIIELNADGSWNWITTLTPYVITNTPSASQTPWIITATPKVGTPEPFPTPTIEPTIDPITPAPTVPPPDKEPCYATVIVQGLRLRTSPGGSILGAWNFGDRLKVHSVQLDFVSDLRVDEWAEVSRPDGTSLGWSAAFYSSTQYIDYDDTQPCLEIRFPEPQVALLYHTVPGFNVGNAQISFNILANKQIGYGYKNFSDMDKCLSVLPRGICEYRHGNPDCPQNIGYDNPQESASKFFYENSTYACDMLKTYENAYYEPVNECYYGDDNHPEDYVWWVEWLQAYMDIADAYGCPKLIIPTLGPGHGSELMFKAWKVTLERNAANGGLFGEHAYTPYHDDGLCICDEWLACRHRTNQEVRLSIGLDIRVAITEAAKGWGNDPVDVADFVCWYEEIKNDTFVHSVALWTMGFHPTWPLANLDNYVVPIAQQVN